MGFIDKVPIRMIFSFWGSTFFKITNLILAINSSSEKGDTIKSYIWSYWVIKFINLFETNRIIGILREEHLLIHSDMSRSFADNWSSKATNGTSSDANDRSKSSGVLTITTDRSFLSSKLSTPIEKIPSLDSIIKF